MGDESPDSTEQDLANALAACDDALARGIRRPSLDAFKTSQEGEDGLKKKLACAQMLRKALSPRGSGSATWPRLSPINRVVGEVAPSPPSSIGRFQVRRELGRGAFGVVYLAYDPKLGRDVALKVPRFDLLLTPAVLARFETEARAAAGLDHPNIVQLFEAGEAGSSFYLASAFCSGVGLDEWLRRRRSPVPVEWATDVLIALADAIEHAHSRGVLHRDLKPANILLVGERLEIDDDRTLDAAAVTETAKSAPVPKITDFGLAKLDPLLGSPDDESFEQLYQTRSGAVVGTPAYMAPEQAGGPRHSVGPTADVYALGVVLYELLTGRPPFVGLSVFDTLHAVRNSDPVPPSRLRAKLPRDIETICLKCLEKDPKRRYPTAKALADDLRRSRRLEPIQARPASTTEHVIRWCRRNPQAAGLTAALIWVVCLGLAGVFWQWRRAEVEAAVAKDGETAAQHARTVALAARDRADSEGRRAREAVEIMTAAGMELYKQQGQQEAGRKILEQAAAFHEGFVAEGSNDPEVMASACVAWNRLGWIREELGQRTSALAAMRRSVELADQLLTMAPDDDARIMQRARAGQDLGRFLYFANRRRESSQTYEAAETLWRRMCEHAPTDDDRRLRLANSLLNHAVVLQTLDQNAAEKMYLEALGLQRENAEKHPRHVVFRREVALTLEALSILAWNRGDSRRGEELGRQADDLLTEMERENPKNEQCRWYAARSRYTQGAWLFHAGRRREADPLIRRAERGLNDLRIEFPRNLQYLEAVVNAAEVVGRCHASTGNSDAAEAALRNGVELFKKLQSASLERAQSSRLVAIRIHMALAAHRAIDWRIGAAFEALRAIPSAMASPRK